MSITKRFEYKARPYEWRGEPTYLMQAIFIRDWPTELIIVDAGEGFGRYNEMCFQH
jgi:hypothetical protein